MKGVTFGSYHSFEDLALILTQKIIGTPAPKKEVVEIPGGDGVLDLTEFFGETKYDNRQLTFEFSTIVPQSEFMELFSIVQNALHGKKMEITLDDDIDWHYIGRIEVSEWKTDKNIGKLTVECDCEAYKIKNDETIVQATVDGATTVILANSNKTVVPTIDITGEVSLTYGTNFYTLAEGRYDLPAVRLLQGDNTILLDGAGTATFTYRERSL